MDIRKPTTKTEAREIIGMVQYYRYKWTRPSHVLSPMIYADSFPKGRSILWNNYLEVPLCDTNLMVSAKTLLKYLDRIIIFTAKTYDSYRQMGAVISQDNKPIDLFSTKLSKPQNNYTMIEKDLLLISELSKQ